jgi:excisionase family DNA binding protein
MDHMKSANAFNAPAPGRIAYNLYEALQVMNIGRTKFYEEVKLGRIKIVKFGQKTLIPATEPIKWLERVAADASARAEALKGVLPAACTEGE